MRNKVLTYLKILYIFVLSFYLLPIFLLDFYNHPAADDFAIAGSAQSYGVLGNVYHLYLRWFGRYFAAFLGGLEIFYISHYFIYQIVSFLLISLFLIAIYKLIKIYYSAYDSILFSLVFGLLFFSYLPVLSEVLYWQAGSLVYLAPNIYLLFLVSILLKENKFQFYVVFLLIFMTIGSNELSMLVTLLFLSYFLISSKTKAERNKIFGLIFFAMICSLVVVLAPGNKIRTSALAQSTLSGIHNFDFSLSRSWHGFYNSFIRWNAKGSLFLTILLLLIRFQVPYKKLKLNQMILYWVIFCLSIWAIYFAFYWSTGIAIEARTESVICFLFIIGFSFLLFNTLYGLKWGAYKEVAFHSLFILLLFSFSQQYNLKYARRDLTTGKAQLYHSLIMQRHNLFKTNQGAEILYVKKIHDGDLPFAIHSKRTNFPNSVDAGNGSWLVWFQNEFKIKEIVLVE